MLDPLSSSNRCRTSACSASASWCCHCASGRKARATASIDAASPSLESEDMPFISAAASEPTLSPVAAIPTPIQYLNSRIGFSFSRTGPPLAHKPTHCRKLKTACRCRPRSDEGGPPAPPLPMLIVAPCFPTHRHSEVLDGPLPSAALTVAHHTAAHRIPARRGSRHGRACRRAGTRRLGLHVEPHGR